MIKNVEVIVIHPAWILVFILGYLFGTYVFLKTNSIPAAVISLWLWLSSTAYAIQLYYAG